MRIFLAFLIGLAVGILISPWITDLPQSAATLLDTPVSLVASVGSFLNAHEAAVAAIATAVMALFSIALFFATRGIHKHSVVSERAYLKMSPVVGGDGGLGLKIDRGCNKVAFIMKIENFGRTPAYLNDVHHCWMFKPKGEHPPTKPNYGLSQKQDNRPGPFLVAGDRFFEWPTFDKIPGETLDKIESGEETLWIYGYVDYTDVSRQRHRAGYGRQYAPGRTDFNLIHMSKNGYNYNYDRPLNRRGSA